MAINDKEKQFHGENHDDTLKVSGAHKSDHFHGHSGSGEHAHHSDSLVYELMCHFPYAIFSIAFGLILLSVFGYYSLNTTDLKMIKKGYKLLFHSFHFLHIVFAATGTVLTFLRFSNNMLRALVVGVVSPIIFCMLSDVIMPYIGGLILGQPMDFHICFITEWKNVVPFLIIGIINGILLAKHYSAFGRFFSMGSHFVHILISTLASLFYMVSHGFVNWANFMGPIFVVMIAAVVFPCTMSDVVVPMYFARKRR
ncbi:hypothetical protein M1446_03150 [Candidatus Dependentiae bacterium]|nr:hypothetical protein [Candidatus Dependentiae bacterium]